MKSDRASRAKAARPFDRRWVLLGLTLALTAVVVTPWRGCRQYPPVSCPEALTMIKLAYTACRTRSEERLEAATARLDQLASNGQCTRREAELFGGILERARAGDWDGAAAASLRYAQDQVD